MSCDVPINDSSPCLESGGTPASLASNTPSALPQSRCQHCQAFVDNDGQCHNPDCTAGREHLESLAQQPLLTRSETENRRPTVDSIDWPEAEPLAWGGYAMVFRVAPGYVAKVGEVEPSEAKAQRWGHEQGYALPVSDYQRQVRVPYEVTEQICAVHGPRGAIIAHPDCTCGHPQDILLMPEAEYIPPEERDEIHKFQQKVADEAFDSQVACLDVRPSNVMRWRGNLVIVDWGEVGG
jgi:hypothetical protein